MGELIKEGREGREPEVGSKGHVVQGDVAAAARRCCRGLTLQTQQVLRPELKRQALRRHPVELPVLPWVGVAGGTSGLPSQPDCLPDAVHHRGSEKHSKTNQSTQQLSV